MMKKLCVIAVLLFAVTGMVFSGGQQGTSESGQKVVLRLGGINAIEDPLTKAMEMMAKIAGERSNGMLEVQVYPASQLGSGTTQMEAVSMGSQDMLAESSTYVGTFLKDRQIEGMFFIFRDAAHYKAFMESDLNKQMEEDFRKLKGIRIICRNWYRAPRSFVSKVPFDAKTFEGLKIRVPDIRGYLESVTAMGGSPVQLAWAEVFLGLMQGVVDAAESPVDTLYANKLYEAAKHIILTEHLRDTFTIFFNDRSWSRLSEEHQKILIDASHEAGNWYTNQVDMLVADAIKNLKEVGATFHEIDLGPLREKVAKRVAEIEAEGSMWRKGLYQEIQNIR